MEFGLRIYWEYNPYLMLVIWDKRSKVAPGRLRTLRNFIAVKEINSQLRAGGRSA